MKLSILLVEDNHHKRQKILDLIFEVSPDSSVKEAHSFTSGSKMIFEHKYDLIILDIGLPTYDRVGTESGGRKRMLGGREIARKLVRRNKETSMLFITQYDAFSEGSISLSLEEVRDVLSHECSSQFAGLIHYDSSKSAWKENLTLVLKNTEKKAK